MSKRYVWNPTKWYQWVIGSVLFAVPALALLWLFIVSLWAASL